MSASERFDELAFRIRMRHVASMVHYLESGERRVGLHVTDLVYGCPKYARLTVMSRHGGDYVRNMDEGVITKLTIGKLLDSLPVGDWHHVNVKLGPLLGQIDDIAYEDGKLIVIDKKTIADKPPEQAHDHYVRQVQLYMYILRHGEVESCEMGDVERLRELLSNGTPMVGAILYVDVSTSTKTVVSKVVQVPFHPIAAAQVEQFLNWMLTEIESERPKARPSWFCQYCPYMIKCWSEEVLPERGEEVEWRRAADLT